MSYTAAAVSLSELTVVVPGMFSQLTGIDWLWVKDMTVCCSAGIFTIGLAFELQRSVPRDLMIFRCTFW